MLVIQKKRKSEKYGRYVFLLNYYNQFLTYFSKSPMNSIHLFSPFNCDGLVKNYHLLAYLKQIKDTFQRHKEKSNLQYTIRFKRNRIANLA